MAATITIKHGENFVLKQFTVGSAPRIKFPGIKHDMVISVMLSEYELSYAISVLGAAPVNKDEVIYFGDEARRIFFNW